MFERDTPAFYHHYAIVELEHTQRRMEGLEFVFVELPKFKPEDISNDRMRKLWLRFMTETGGEMTGEPAAELLDSPETREALECVAESAFSREELETYDRYWDSIRCEVTLLDGSYQEGKQEGKLEGKLEVAAALKRAGILSDEQIVVATGLAVEQVQAL